MQLASCPNCQQQGSRPIGTVVTSREYQLVQCRRCGLVFTSPRPTPDELDHFYSHTYFAKGDQRIFGYADYAGIPEANARQMWREIRTTPVVTGCTGSRRLLDVGAATGGFLAEAAADGWSVLGVEFSKHAIERATNDLHVRVLHGDVFHPELNGRSFELVTLWHVLEHAIEPRLLLEKCFELTTPGGHCLVELPSWASLGRRLRGLKWAQLKPPEHINFFTPRNLADSMESVGFKVTSAKSIYPSFTDRTHLKKSDRRPADFAVAAVGKLASALGMGGYARVVAQRPHR